MKNQEILDEDMLPKENKHSRVEEIIAKLIVVTVSGWGTPILSNHIEYSTNQVLNTYSDSRVDIFLTNTIPTLTLAFTSVYITHLKYKIDDHQKIVCLSNIFMRIAAGFTGVIGTLEPFEDGYLDQEDIKLYTGMGLFIIGCIVSSTLKSTKIYVPPSTPPKHLDHL